MARGRAAACLTTLAAVGGLLLAVSHQGTAGPIGAARADGADDTGAEEAPTPPPTQAAFDLSVSQATALDKAWRKVDALSKLVERRGVVPDFGKRAEAIVKNALAEAEEETSSMEKLLDAPLRALFHRQLQTLMVRCADLYEEKVASRPNPLEAARSAEEAFLHGAEALVRRGSGWSYETEHQDLLAQVAESEDGDMQLMESQAEQGRGKQITIEVIKKLQEQQAAVRREVDTRGAFPWNMKWQYMIENSPVGFRGQYMQGRSVVELLLMPSPDPRYKKNLLNRIGPLNLAVAFDMLL